MKYINHIFAAITCILPAIALTGCVDDDVNDGYLTEAQLGSNAEPLVWALGAEAVDVFNYSGGEYHYDWGQGALMHIRDVMCDDYAVKNSDYDQFSRFEWNQYLGQDYVFCAVPFYTIYQQVQVANNLIRAINPDNASNTQLGYLGAGYANRAWIYLDAARMYECLPAYKYSTVNSSGNDVQGLTLPIVTEKTTLNEATKNPRATHYQMFNFIMSDLDAAEKYISNLIISSKSIPHLNVVYGLKARAYMWHASFMAEGVTIPSDTLNTEVGALTASESFAKAQEYARKAIDLGQNTPMTQYEWTDVATGFNTNVSSWMYSMTLVKESGAVQTGIINWVSWCSNETSFGYASAGPMPLASAKFYNRISDNDFRKLSWKAPADGKLSGKESYVNADLFGGLPDYASLKFRPGSGNADDYTVSCVVSVPLMRIEEMYFIEAEAAIQQGKLDEGKQLLVDFIKTYRNPSYAATATDKDALISELLFQKQIELWGEGQTFFDYKRLNRPIDRIYDGTNFGDNAQLSTKKRPAWMNFVITRGETQTNTALKDWNTPDPSNLYTAGVISE